MESSPLLKLAERYIADRTNVRPTIQELREHPEIFDALSKEMNVALVTLNNFIQAESVGDEDRTKFVNAASLRDALRDEKLPTLLSLGADRSLKTVKTGVGTFKFADELMRRGETGGQEPKWSFHQQGTGENLTSWLMLEIYGKFTERHSDRIALLEKGGFTVVLALEEMIARYREAMPKLFESVKGWYDVSEGFSQELVGDLQAEPMEQASLKERTPFQGKVRLLRHEDLEPIRPILEDWIRDRDTGELLPREVQEDLDLMYESLHGRNKRRYFVAEDTNGDVIGVIGHLPPTDRMRQFARGKKTAEMVNMYVAKSERAGRGVGRALFRSLEERLRKEEYDEVVWNSGPRYLPTAWRFYNNLPGVEQTGVAERLYGDADAMVWRKTLKN